MIANVGVHVRPVAESLIRCSCPPLEPRGSRAKVRDGTGSPRRHRRRAPPLSCMLNDASASFVFRFPALSVTIDPCELRQRLRVRRKSLSDAMRQEAALAVARRLADWPAFVAAIRIASYWACDGELNPAPLLEHAWAANMQVYLPVLADDPPQSLQFALYRSGSPLRRNRFNIPEPDIPPAERLQPQQLHLVLAPLVAFDSTGTRLGMGGGF